MGVGFLVGFADTCAGGLAKVIDLWKTVIMVPAGQSAEPRPPGLWIQHRTPIQRVGSRWLQIPGCKIPTTVFIVLGNRRDFSWGPSGSRCRPNQDQVSPFLIRAQFQCISRSSGG